MREPQGHPYPKDFRAHVIRVIEAIVDADQVTDKAYVDALFALVSGALVYQGTWDASTNTPTLADGTGTTGHFYAVTVGGTLDLGSGNITFTAGDRVIHNGTIWQKWDTNDVITSVFGRTGDVVAVSGDYAHSEIGIVTADQHHLEDTIARQSSGYYISDAVGDNGYTGTEKRPFKTGQAALDASVLAGNFVHRLFFDFRGFGNYTLDLAGLVAQFVTVEGYQGFGNITITQDNTTSVYVKNCIVTLEEGATQSGNSTATISHGALIEVFGPGGAGNPTQTQLYLHGCSIGTGAGNLMTHLANTAFTDGYTVDTSTNLNLLWSETDLRGNKIINQANGVGVQDGAAFGQIGAAVTTHTGLPDAHHTEDHAARHKDGGADELDVSELAGALGGAGEIPETDGAAVGWVDPDGRYDPKSHGISDNTKHSGSLVNDNIALGDANGLVKDSGVAISSVVGGLIYQGTWDASTNTPTLADGTGTKGYYYRVSVGGSQDLGSGSITFAAEDFVAHNGSIWQKIDHTDQVTSVFTRQGAVVALASDYDASQIDNDSGVAGAFVDDALDQLNSDLPVQATEGVAGIGEIATQPETNTGTDDDRIVTPLKLTNFVRTRRYLVSTRVRVGIGAGAASDGQIQDVPVILFSDTTDEEADMANHIRSGVDLSVVNPFLEFHFVAASTPAGVGTETIRMQLEIRYRADGEGFDGAYDETLTADIDLATGVAYVHFHEDFVLDRTKMASGDGFSVKITRLGTHLNDDYDDDIGLENIWLVYEGTGGD